MEAGAVMKALVGGNNGGHRLDHDVKIPVPKPGTMLCRVHAVALSPYDVKIVEFFNTPGAVRDRDFAGIVVQVGDGVTRFNVGDRVLAVTFGLNPTDKTAGAFAECSLATYDLSYRVPNSLSFAQASSMGLGIATAGLTLFEALGLQLFRPHADDYNDQETNMFVLVSGGATGTGNMATQLLTVAGYTPIGTCSPANNDLCQSHGAAACFDYHSPMCGADIREYTGNKLTSVFDCVTDAPPMKICYETIGASGGMYVALEAISPIIKYSRRNVRAEWLMAPTIMGTAVELPGTYGRASALEHRDFASKLFILAERLLQDGCIKKHPLGTPKGV